MKRVSSLFTVSALVLFILTMIIPAWANNISVGTPILTGQNTTDNYVDVQFDLSWDNSWKIDLGPSNWDAAWVFVKYKPTGGNWAHAYLNTTAGNHTIPAGYTCSVGVTGSYGIGAFIYRSSNGSGNTSLSDVQLRWEYGDNGLGDDANVTVKVFAIEMVYVPEDTLNLNTTASGNMNNEFTSAGITQITSESALAEDAIKWSYDNQWGGQGDSDALGGSYPKGYAAFYCLKYEVSQGQYADFLNTLTSTQATNRYYSTTSSRYTISGSHPNFSASRPDRACNYLSWVDGCAYTDWAGLRPMSELEFEKACRGTQSVVTDEFAWGTSTIVADAPLTISGAENGTETITTDVSDGACCYSANAHSGGDGGTGPLRCGIFAKYGTSRTDAGASYYGIMELSGNVYEQCVTVADQDHNGNTTDAGTFDGSHGDGALNTSGDADVSSWPGTDAVGIGFRGGGFGGAGASFWRVSDRELAGFTYTGHGNDYGFRGVRSAQ